MKMIAPLEVGICCEEIDRLKQFYVDELGFTEINDAHVPADKARHTGLTEGAYRVVRLQTPYGERIKLLQPETKPNPPAPNRGILERRGNTYLTFIVEDLAALLAKLKRLNFPLLSGQDFVEVRPGTYLVFTNDPEGNVIEFVQYADIGAYRPDIHQEA